MESKSKKEQGALEKWIEDSLASYKEKYFNEKGFFSPSKFYASLLHLYSKKIISAEEIAKMSKTTYGTLRVWRTEEVFKNQIKFNIESYTDKFLEIFRMLNPEKTQIVLKEFTLYSYELQQEILLKEMRYVREQINSIRSNETRFQSIITAINCSSDLLILAMTATKAFREHGDLVHAQLMSWLQIKLLHDIRGVALSLYIDDVKKNKKPDITQLEIIQAYDKSISKTIMDAMGERNFNLSEAEEK